jgi:5-methylcytosine-specific restriction endonuclease McrA
VTGEPKEATLIALMKADPHDWGEGHVHQIEDGQDKTLCGRTPANTPGKKIWGLPDDITCKGCLRVLEARERQAEYQAQYQQDETQRKLDREAYQQEWWRAYNAYLLTDRWNQRRSVVMRRSNGICEGCGTRQAVQVHHLRYPQGCLPGSEQWLAQEKLWDLQATCRECHDDVHRYPRYY